MLLVVDMTVGDEEAAAVDEENGIGSLNGKIKEHLVHFGITVAAYADDVGGAGIETFGYGLRVKTLAKTVPGTIVEYVAQENEHFVVVGVVEVEHSFESGE